MHHDAYVARSQYIDHVTPNMVKEILEQAASKPGQSREAVRAIFKDLGKADPEAANLIRSPQIDDYLNRVAPLAAIWSSLHTPTDLSKLSMAYTFGHAARGS